MFTTSQKRYHPSRVLRNHARHASQNFEGVRSMRLSASEAGYALLGTSLPANSSVEKNPHWKQILSDYFYLPLRQVSAASNSQSVLHMRSLSPVQLFETP